jgi:glycosyltransferase involved in cell wall biosynthesis
VRIALASLDFPPDATEGIARQRQVLAEGLAQLGHEVHVVTLGAQDAVHEERGVRIIRVKRGETVREFVPSLPVLNRPFTDAQLLCEGILALADRSPLDVIDVPLWLAQPLALVRHAPCPVVVWLQTTLLHLIALQQRQPRAHEMLLADVDRYVLSHAAGCIADSDAVLLDLERLYALPSLSAKTITVHPGLPATVLPAMAESAAPGIEGLVVGRLEHRKGTRLLFDVLPSVLAAVPELRIRFVGRDNSGADGFQRETGLTYVEAFARRYPQLGGRVRFDGYVDDDTLQTRYAAADFLLHPALYESFGLIFLEAMRAGRPTIAFRAGGASEVFRDGEHDGGVLCSSEDPATLAEAVITLAKDAGRRRTIGLAGRDAFERRFTSEHMARRTADAYTEISRRTHGAVPPARPRLFQVMEALMDRDAVSRITRTNAATVAEAGGERPIMALFAESSVRAETGRLRGARFRAGDAAIFHYWGFSRLERVIERFPGRKAIHYHNITPPCFFAPRTAHYEMTERGYAQLTRLADRFDLVLGDSTFNLSAFAAHVTTSKPMMCVYPSVDGEVLRDAAWDHDTWSRLRAECDGPLWLFVGRFAPNKRQDQIMLAFEHFAAATGGGHLLMVGDMMSVPAYVRTLERLRARLTHGARITFAPSMPDSSLYACYRAADLFVCASEHEGFCLPLAEAMAFDLPVIALDRGAVGETLGPAGLLVHDWDPEHVAACAADVLESTDTRARVLAAQRERLLAFAPSATAERLRAAIAWLRTGTPSPFLVDSDIVRSTPLEKSCV